MTFIVRLRKKERKTPNVRHYYLTVLPDVNNATSDTRHVAYGGHTSAH